MSVAMHPTRPAKRPAYAAWLLLAASLLDFLLLLTSHHTGLALVAPLVGFVGTVTAMRLGHREHTPTATGGWDVETCVLMLVGFLCASALLVLQLSLPGIVFARQ